MFHPELIAIWCLQEILTVDNDDTHDVPGHGTMVAGLPPQRDETTPLAIRSGMEL
jgi:hypothetical protein